MLPRKEGFWRSESEPDLPTVPKNKITRLPDLDDFLKKLSRTEGKAKTVHYKGFSRCRICDCINGSAEHSYKGWVWPSGYMHYLKEHNVMPSNDFYEAVVSWGKKKDK